MYNDRTEHIDHTIKDTRWLVGAAQRALANGDKRGLEALGLGTTDAQTYVRVYPQYTTQSR